MQIISYSNFLIVIITFLFITVHAQNPRYYLPITVDSKTIKSSNIPCALDVDFHDLLTDLNVKGKFDRFSVKIEGKDPYTGNFVSVDYRVGEHYKYGTAGTVYWLIENPKMTEFRIWFDVETIPHRKPRSYIPVIGVGDELLFNSSEPVPIYSMTTNLLVDYNNDGITDILTINDYSDRFGWPYDGIIFHPGIEENDKGIKTRDYFRIRYIPENSDELRFLHARYNFVYPTDWDEDGLIDLFYVSMENEEIHQVTMPENYDLFQSSNYFTFLKNTGKKDISGLPILKETKHYPALAITHNAYTPAVAAEDIDGDGKKDLIGIKSLNGLHDTPIGKVGIAKVFYYRNVGSDSSGLPNIAGPVELKTTDGKSVFGYHTASGISFGDVNKDGKIDIIINNMYVRPHQVLWYENKGGLPPLFEPMKLINGLPNERRSFRWASIKNREGLLATESQNFFIRSIKNNQPVFTYSGNVREIYGPLVQGMQEKPDWIDWDNDGDLDLIAGEAFGRIHLYENIGTQKYPKFNKPFWVKADGKILEVNRYTVFGEGPHIHPMGYPSVTCVDWDKDGLFDLVIPNETNRVYWFKNVGELGKPKFGKRRQILPDGYIESKEKINRSYEISNDPEKSNNGVYPYLDDEPFFWRQRLAIADYTGDGLEDMIALNGSGNLVLYERYYDSNGKLKLKQGKQLYYANGDAIIKPHFSKFRNVDWNNDGLIDIVVTQNLFTRDQRSLLFLKNCGTKTFPVFERPKALQMWDKVITYSSHGLQPSFLDWDNDGSLDFVGCSESGFYVLFRNAVLKHSKPKVRIGIPQKQ